MSVYVQIVLMVLAGVAGFLITGGYLASRANRHRMLRYRNDGWEIEISGYSQKETEEIFADFRKRIGGQ